MQGNTRIEGDNYLDVAQSVLRYRVENKLDIGNPLAEVLDFVCSAHPHFCTESSPTSGLSPLTVPLASRVAQWVAKLYHTLRGQKIDLLFVTKEVAEARASICSSCPNNVSWAGGCSSCARDTRQVSFPFRADRKTSQPNELFGCSALGHDNATAVWLKSLPADDPASVSQLPTVCWRYK